MLGLVSAAARAVWNGPFYIGKLTRPVSLGEVAMKLLETTWRGALILAFGVSFLLAAGIAWDARPPPPSLEDQIAGVATLDGASCDASSPLRVALTNHSKEKVGLVRFKVSAYEQGRSTDLANGAYRYNSDAIIPPRETVAMCFEAPALNGPHELAGLRFVITIAEAQATTLP